MHCKGRFGISRNTNELVAIEDRALEMDVILNECKTLDSNSGKGDDAEVILSSVAKNFLVFIATTWSAKGKKIQFLAARYGLKSITASFLIREVRNVIMSLAYYGFIVDTIAGDGASENRATFKSLATITAREVLSKVWTDDELKDLPLDFKIAFPHPHPLYRKRVMVIVGGEMPHWGKKFRNAFDNKTRNLVFRGMEMNLKMIHEMWKSTDDYSITSSAHVRLYKFTRDHFVLNAYLKMRVFLALQIPSQTTIKMIKDHCDTFGINVAKYQPMIDLFNNVDRLVDIMNGKAFQGSKDKDVQLIDCPKHSHITELFDVLRLFEEWKEESGGFTKKFITQQTYEDLVWMVFGVAAHAVLYLKDDKSRVMHQGRSGTDFLEHFFAKLRYINSNPTMQQSREAASKVSSDVGMESRAFERSRGNSGTAPSQTTAGDLLAPIEKD